MFKRVTSTSLPIFELGEETNDTIEILKKELKDLKELTNEIIRERNGFLALADLVCGEVGICTKCGRASVQGIVCPTCGDHDREPNFNEIFSEIEEIE
jgi:hypothetical protein